jgi:hypothetical protein
VAADKVTGTCSVCLREIQLRGDQPIRHGFAAKNIQHGQHTGYHTGPCPGVNFPHLGISDEGTRWALKDAQRQLVNAEQELARLATHPDITWYPPLRGSTMRQRLPDTSRPVVLRYGDAEAYANDGRPTYARAHKGAVALEEARKSALEDMIARYEAVLASWTPAKYPTKGSVSTGPAMHMALERKINDKIMTGTCCLGVRRGHRMGGMAKTTDPAQVTCKRCRTTLGLP